MSYDKTFYLTGSINQPTVDDAFRFVGSRLQPGVTRVPDGEPGDRANWVLTQTGHFLDNPTLEVTEVDGRRLARLPEGAAGSDVRFPAFDYQDHAIASYARFRAARDRGELAPESKFLVSIPTPFNAVNFFVEFDSQVEVARAYEAPLKDSVDAIQDAIPHDDLVIQWDLPVEDATIEGWFPNPYRSVEEIFEVTARPASWVRDGVELAFHLCYGDSKFGASPFMGDPPDAEAAARGGRHVYPRDASVIVAVSNGLSRHVPHRRHPGRDRHGVESARALAAPREPRHRTGDGVLPRPGPRRGRCGGRPLPGGAGGEVPPPLRPVHRMRAGPTLGGATRPGRRRRRGALRDTGGRAGLTHG